MIELIWRSRAHKVSLFLALLLTGHAAPATAEKQLDFRTLQAPRDCLSKLEANSGKLVEIACPQLKTLFQNENIARRINLPRLADATPASIRELQGIFKDFSETASPIRFDYGGLNELLAETLVVRDKKAKSLWERFIDWLKQRQPENSSDWEWLKKILWDLQPPEWLGTWLLRGTIALTLVIALGIIVNEIRASDQFRLFRKRRKSKPSGTTQITHSQPINSPNRQQIAMLPLARQPAALLNWIIGELVSSTLLPDNRSLTNGEYCVVIHRINARAAQGFYGLMDTIDKTIYGNQPIDADGMRNLFSRTDDVLGDCLRVGAVARERYFE